MLYMCQRFCNRVYKAKMVFIKSTVQIRFNLTNQTRFQSVCQSVCQEREISLSVQRMVREPQPELITVT